jgi:6-phosphogluconolactonase
MSIKFRGLIALLVVTGLSGLVMSCGGSSRPAGLLLVISQGATDVNSYGINLNTGVLTQINTAAPVAANSIPTAIVLDPSGNFAYVANATNGGGPGSITAYSVKSDGKLSPVGSNPATGVNPVSLAIDHGGHFLFVSNQGSDTVSVFSIGANAALTQVGTFAVVTSVPGAPAASPSSVAVTPSGSFVFVANSGQNTVSVFSVDSIGALTAVAGSPFAAGTAPAGVTVTPNGNYLYVANQGSNNISAFTICGSAVLGCATMAPGSLTSETVVSAGLAPMSLAVDPAGNFLYATDRDSNQLSGYRITPSTGVLTALSSGAVSTGTAPVFVAIHPAGNYLYVANSGSDAISSFHLVTQSGVLGLLAPAPALSRPVGIALK